jgi:hypothetical protein
VTDDDDHVLVDNNRLPESELGDRRLHRVDCLGVVPRVPSIGHQPLDPDIGDERNLTTGLGKGKRCGAELPAMRGAV